jgi:hypothetical protein
MSGFGAFIKKKKVRKEIKEAVDSRIKVFCRLRPSLRRKLSRSLFKRYFSCRSHLQDLFSVLMLVLWRRRWSEMHAVPTQGGNNRPPEIG